MFSKKSEIIIRRVKKGAEPEFEVKNCIITSAAELSQRRQHTIKFAFGEYLTISLLLSFGTLQISKIYMSGTIWDSTITFSGMLLPRRNVDSILLKS